MTQLTFCTFAPLSDMISNTNQKSAPRFGFNIGDPISLLAPGTLCPCFCRGGVGVFSIKDLKLSPSMRAMSNCVKPM